MINSSTSNLKIEKYFPPIYDGQNTETNYRYLALLPAAFFAYQTINYKSFLYSRYRMKEFREFRWAKFQTISPAAKRLYFLSLPAFFAFDLVYRNIKYNSNKPIEYILGYSLDLLLFHSLASLALPLMAVNATANFFPVFWSKLTGRRRLPILILSSISMVCVAPLQIKGIDIFSDLILDLSFRKYVFDFKKQFSGSRQLDLDVVDKIDYNNQIEREDDAKIISKYSLAV